MCCCANDSPRGLVQCEAVSYSALPRHDGVQTPSRCTVDAQASRRFWSSRALGLSLMAAHMLVVRLRESRLVSVATARQYPNVMWSKVCPICTCICDSGLSCVEYDVNHV